MIAFGAERSWSGVGQVNALAGDVILVNPGELHDGAPLDGAIQAGFADQSDGLRDADNLHRRAAAAIEPDVFAHCIGARPTRSRGACGS